MPDYGAMYADRAISEVNRDLRRTYRQAQKELKEKLADFNRRFARKNAAQKEKLKNGEISKQDYKNWLTGQVFTRSQWESKIKQINAVMLDNNRQSMKLINEKKLDVFAENYNYLAFKAERDIAVSFSLYNAESVARLILDDPQILPEWKVDGKKDYSWNKQKVNNIIKQGIIQGESIDEITKRLCTDLCTQNENRMRMFARTAMTGAQNAGRQQQMEDAADLGIEVLKKWIATLDSRTRDSHRVMDGEEVPYNEDFTNGLEYPGDPAGDPAEVYNCRCTMVSVYPKYEDRSQARVRRARDEYTDKEGEVHSYSYLTKDQAAYQEWKKGKQKKNPDVTSNIAGEIWGASLGRGKVKAGVFNKQEEKIVNDFIKNMPEPFAREYRRLYNTVTVTHDPYFPTSWDRARNIINFNPNSEFTEKTAIHEGAHWFDDNFSFDDTIELKGRRRKRDADGNVLRDSDGRAIYENYTETLTQHYSTLSSWMSDKYTDDLRKQDFESMQKFFGIDNAVDSGEKFASFLSWYHKNEDVPYIGVITDIAYGMMPNENWMELISGVELHKQQYWNDGMNLFRESFANFSEIILSQEKEIIEMFEQMAPHLYNITRKGFVKLWKSK